jgi:ribosomal-protein-alanine N-acetyltransferase
VTIVPLEVRHIPSLLRLQSSCPEVAQWTAADYQRIPCGEMAGWVAEAGESSDDSRADVIGFIVARRIASDVEILNFAVDTTSRRHGVGSGLLHAVLAWSRSLGAKQAMLDVRAANETALHFYTRHNFQIVGRRPRYYSSPIDDALLLTAFLE